MFVELVGFMCVDDCGFECGDCVWVFVVYVDVVDCCVGGDVCDDYFFD